jgi:branched-subunit amino acid permease
MRRDDLIGWLVWGGLMGLAAALALGLLALVIGAIPILVAVFPLTISAVAIFLGVAWWRARRR